MSEKKILSREEFEQLREDSAADMSEDRELHNDAVGLISRADKYHWIHQSNWLGEPALNLPQDMFAMQDIIYRTQPDFLVEVGVAWGGSALFYTTVMEIIGHGRYIGVDLFMPEDMKTRLHQHEKLAHRISLINGSSVDMQVFDQVKHMVGQSKKVMVLLDSYHTEDHVLQELALYSQLVGKGFYLICGDTIVEQIHNEESRDRPWGIGNNPKTALDKFLGQNKRFVNDKRTENSLLLSCHPGGYLQCISD